MCKNYSQFNARSATLLVCSFIYMQLERRISDNGITCHRKQRGEVRIVLVQKNLV